MKTYKKIVDTPRLVIRYDDTSLSPRIENSNLGYFITRESRTRSPDSHEIIEAIVKVTGEEANTVQEHIKLMWAQIENSTGEKVEMIQPITKHEHGNVTYRAGQANGFDDSNCGFYIVTDKTLKESYAGTKTKWLDIIEAELEDYTSWCNGERYMYTLYNKEGEVVDECGGFNEVEAIRDCLPKEWKKEDLSKYIINN